MAATSRNIGDRALIEPEGLTALFESLASAGYRVVGPTVRDEAIVYDDVASVEDLPIGLTDEHAGGHYRLIESGNGSLFGYVVGPQSWKKLFYPPRVRLWQAKRDRGTMTFDGAEPERAPVALIGVRSCELSAIAIQDRVFIGGEHVDPIYSARRKGAFIVAVNCTVAGANCFCDSMDTGPRVRGEYDLALTEVAGNGRHCLVLEIGSDAGAKIAEGLPLARAGEAEVAASDEAVERAAQSMGRSLETAGLKEALYASFDHPRWDDVAARCLGCANCTMVCPTCFCSDVEDVTDLKGETAERVRSWGSCFTLEFSHLVGGPVRASGRSRYRQWLVHKLASWIDQFDTSGCVGCGRCITWCPVGIDITEEAQALREKPKERLHGR